MKQTLQKEWKNILFLVLIVAAAIVIYLLSRGESASAQPAQPTAQNTTAKDTAQETPVATEPIRQQPGVTEGVFKTYLSMSDVIDSEPLDLPNNTYIVSYRKAITVRARLKYELTDGCISSVELAFPLPKEMKQRSNRYPEALIYDANAALKRALPKGVPDVLCDVISAACSERIIYKKTIRAWAKTALSLEGTEDKVEEQESGCRFVAYRTMENNVEQLVCAFYLSQD